MKANRLKLVVATSIAILIPAITQAETLDGKIASMQDVLDQVYENMIPLCGELIGVGQGIGGFAALWYISSRVWRHLANAEPIDFYPLLRPFAIGLAIMLFPSVIDVINGVLQPTVEGTADMLSDSNKAIAYLLKQKEEAVQKTITWKLFGDEGTHGKWFKYENPDGPKEDPNLLTNGLWFLMAKTTYAIRNVINQWLSELLQIFYQAAALCINTIRTFYLIVLAILGPLVFGLSIFDGLQNTLTSWIARYINVFLWLPVANIFGTIIAKVQENMLKIDLKEIATTGNTFFSPEDPVYIVFLVIAIVGYFTVPSVAGYIVHAGGANTLLHKSTNLFTSAVSGTPAVVASTAAGIVGAFKSDTSANQSQHQAKENNTNSSPSNGYMHDKLSGTKS